MHAKRCRHPKYRVHWILTSCTHLCHQHPDGETQCYQHPDTHLVQPLLLPPNPRAIGSHSDFHRPRLVLPGCLLRINGTTGCTRWCLPSFPLHYVCVIHVVCFCRLLILTAAQYSMVWLYHNLFSGLQFKFASSTTCGRDMYTYLRLH